MGSTAELSILQMHYARVEGTLCVFGIRKFVNTILCDYIPVAQVSVWSHLLLSLLRSL
jgi:hypothetical protein